MHTRPLLLAALVSVIAAAVLAAYVGVRWPGALGDYNTSAVSVSVRPGVPFTVGMGDLKADGRVRIESIRLHGARGPVALVGAILHAQGHGMVGADRRFPSRMLGVSTHPAVGAILPAHSSVVLEVGLVVRVPERAHVDGVDVLYRERWHGLELRRRAHVGLRAFACGTPRALPLAHCPIPDD